MNRTQAALVGALIAATFVTPVLAASDVCLQRNRIKTWSAIDDSTLMFIDTTDKQYRVQLTTRCMGVDNAGAILVYQTWTELGCLDRGNIFRVVAPGRVESQCSIAQVNAVASPG